MADPGERFGSFLTSGFAFSNLATLLARLYPKNLFFLLILFLPFLRKIVISPEDLGLLLDPIKLSFVFEVVAQCHRIGL